MEQVGAYGEVNRERLRRTVISVAYYALVDMVDFNEELLKEHNAQWVKITELPELIFDHKNMIEDALAILRRKAATLPIGFRLLPEKFTLPQLQSLYEVIYQTPLDKRNFRKKLYAMDILEKLDEKDRTVQNEELTTIHLMWINTRNCLSKDIIFHFDRLILI